MVLRVHGPCTETVRALAGFKLSARGVQTQRTRSSNSARGATTRRPLSTHPQCHLPRPVASPLRRPRHLRPCRSPVTLTPHLPRPLASPSRRPRRLALARCWSSSPHACLARSPHHHATHATL